MSQKRSTMAHNKNNGLSVQIFPYILSIIAVFIAVCFIFTNATGILGEGIRNLFYGLFSGSALLIPLLIINISIFWKTDVVNKFVKYKINFSLVCLVFTSVLVNVFTYQTESLNFIVLFENGIMLSGGGLIGGFIGTLLIKGIGVAGTLIISISMILIFGIFLFGLTPHSIWVYVSSYFLAKKDQYLKQKQKQKKTYKPYFKNPTIKEKCENEDYITQKQQDEIIFEDFDKKDDESVLDLNNIFVNFEDIETIKKVSQPPPVIKQMPPKKIDDEITVERKILTHEQPKSTVIDDVVDQDPLAYKYPPISLLNIDNNHQSIDASSELQENAVKLVDTLKSFNVKTKIVNVSRGPTITRYELVPEVGTKVRSIINLVDDISLNLATTGVRIEAPIPGKPAVGIEVPNKIVAIVYLRELIQNSRFQQAQSRLTASLGVDVAGEPIYIDIAKMPHLLIAGATGMGKSVCINSLIVSLLYKGTPDEVKLILIDPKKVELNIYNGIPHLLVPVVSDPKKAAGALHWAVTEMERRFELIEEVGVRDIRNYNLNTVNDPDKEFMPQIVIIIDELADLMMTAPDDVEESICRLAQKARAAGMHLIIGTQRPSVDVITGLIKANIPSRIAFTVASQIDSRTIIDIAGAEKLIGRGDMLYAPVGFSKPIRVQGSFVSEHEIEEITTFLKQHVGTSEYNSEVIDTIEKEAARCRQTKKVSVNEVDNEQGEDNDSMLQTAIELAIECGKISTSLIQRRLSLGYGRAAKIIDKMQSMGVVSPPEGQKPRTVLISKQDYMEMILDKDEIE